MSAPVSLLFSFVVLFLNLSPLVQSAGIVTYWGTNSDEGSLAEACATKNYQIINLGFVDRFGGGQDPSLNLTGHCDPRSTSNPCPRLSDDIKACKKQGIKVLLSIGGPHGNYSLDSYIEAENFANYLWNNFLGGTASNSRPLGDAISDGIDFYIDSAPQCGFPDPYLDITIASGLLDYVWVRFYNAEACQYTTDANILLAHWHLWSLTSITQLFLGLPATPEAVPGGGYIPPQSLISEVLPTIKSTPTYGGIMLWNRFYDKEAGYSTIIKSKI